MPRHNPERREFNGRSYKKGNERVREIREKLAVRAAKCSAHPTNEYHTLCDECRAYHTTPTAA